MSSKITALTALTSVQTDDVLPVVDVHDTTQASSGTTKKITVANLQAGLLQAANNLSDVTAATARTNLGLGTAATQASAAFDTAGVSATETTRATTAEALLAPLASPTLTGTPTAPTQTAANNSTRLATTAYADTAVSTETTRATTAEALALLKTGGTMSGAIAMGTSKITGVGNGSGAQDVAAFGQVPTVEGTVGNIKPPAAAAALGSSGKWPNSDHVHAWGQTAPARFSPATPTGTTSTTQVMMGLGSTVAFTPTGSGVVLVTICGTSKTTVAQQPVTAGARYGTSTAPTNGAAVTGTRIGPAADTVVSGSGAGAFVGFAITDVLTLTPATAYWFDLAIATGNAADTASVAAISVTLVELP